MRWFLKETTVEALSISDCSKHWPNTTEGRNLCVAKKDSPKLTTCKVTQMNGFLWTINGENISSLLSRTFYSFSDVFHCTIFCGTRKLITIISKSKGGPRHLSPALVLLFQLQSHSESPHLLSTLTEVYRI